MNCWLEVKDDKIIYYENGEQGGCSRQFNLKGELHNTCGPAVVYGSYDDFQVYEYWVNGEFVGKCTCMDKAEMDELEFKVMLYAE